MIAKHGQIGLEVQHTAIYFGALHLHGKLVCKCYKYFGALPLT